MIVCDRHSRTRASGKVTFENEDERYDLCQECLYQIKEFIGDTESKEVEPKKRRGFFKNTA